MEMLARTRNVRDPIQQQETNSQAFPVADLQTVLAWRHSIKSKASKANDVHRCASSERTDRLTSVGSSFLCRHEPSWHRLSSLSSHGTC